MTSGRVRALHEQTGKRVAVKSIHGTPQWSEVWENNPRIASKPEHGQITLVDCPATRPYINRKTRERYYWQKWDIQPGEIFLTDAEKAFAAKYAGRVLVEPNTKVWMGNKAWIPQRWQQFADRAGVPLLQTGPGPLILKGVEHVRTSFRQAAAILAVSNGYVGTDGALHHVAAAFGVPAVVLWSEFCSPEFVGYASHRNIRHADRSCGMRLPCGSCRDSMARISVDEVLENLREIL